MVLVLLWLGSLPLPFPEQAPQCAGLSPRVCAAVRAPAGASWITWAGLVPTDFPAPCGSHFSCSSVRSAWILIYHTTMVFFLWLDWHYFLRAWSLNVFHSFIFGNFFFLFCNGNVTKYITWFCQVHIFSSRCCLVFHLRHIDWGPAIVCCQSLSHWVSMKAQLCVCGVVFGEAASCHFCLLHGRKEA